MSDDLRLWQEALAPLAAAPNSIVQRVIVLDQVASTQDECRRLAGGRPGLLISALRQIAGRGRLGRRWAADHGEGIALTLSVAVQPPERLSIASAIAACEAAEHFAGQRLGIRWPNDIMANGRKLAGILIEQQGDTALVGIGMNVNQISWPGNLAPIAISLRQLIRARVNRTEVIVKMIERLTANLARSDDQLAAAFTPRDTLAGTAQTFAVGAGSVTGIVQRIDPLKGLRVSTADGPRTLPAATTRLVHSP